MITYSTAPSTDLQWTAHRSFIKASLSTAFQTLSWVLEPHRESALWLCPHVLIVWEVPAKERGEEGTSIREGGKGGPGARDTACSGHSLRAALDWR